MFRVIKISISLLVILFLGISSCSENDESKYNPELAKANRFKGNAFFKPYFYPLQSNPKIYIYRDSINGLLEQFHRVYTLTDNEGEHLIVERYNLKGELFEAFNFNTDSLNVLDHVIVNEIKKNTKAYRFNDDFFPNKINHHPIFQSEWKWNDTTTINRTVKRTVLSATAFSQVLGKKLPCIQFNDEMTYLYTNAFTKEKKVFVENQKTIYADGVGLVEWKGTNNKVHFKLERIISQEEWINILKR